MSQDTKWEGNTIAINITNKSQEIGPFPSGYHKAACGKHNVLSLSMSFSLVGFRFYHLDWIIAKTKHNFIPLV